MARNREWRVLTGKHFPGGCTACWDVPHGEWPKPCPCGGEVHAEFGDYTDTAEGNYYLDTECDRCGAPEAAL